MLNEDFIPVANSKKPKEYKLENDLMRFQKVNSRSYVENGLEQGQIKAGRGCLIFQVKFYLFDIKNHILYYHV